MPHCDTLDGPVVKAAINALASGNINYVLIWVPKECEAELKKAFAKTMAARMLGKEAEDVADYWFYETTVRLHRAGEGEAFTGLKPAGLDEGPIVPLADKAIETGDVVDVLDEIADAVEVDLEDRFQRVMDTKDYHVDDVEKGRKYIGAYIGFVVYAHHLFMTVKGSKSTHH